MWFVVLIGVANAPDLDFLPFVFRGFHQGPTHSLIAAPVAGLCAALVAMVVGGASPWRIGLLVTIAYVTHVLFDFMTIQSGTPSAMALWWPFSDRQTDAYIQIFPQIHHDDFKGRFLASLMRWDNVWAVARELVVMTCGWVLYRIGAALWSRRYGASETT